MKQFTNRKRSDAGSPGGGRILRGDGKRLESTARGWRRLRRPRLLLLRPRDDGDGSTGRNRSRLFETFRTLK